MLHACDVSDGVVAEVEETQGRERAHVGHVFDVVAGEVSSG